MKNAIAAVFRRVAPKAVIAIACVLMILSPAVNGMPLGAGSGGSEHGEAKSGPAARILGDLSAAGRTRLRGTLHPQA